MTSAGRGAAVAALVFNAFTWGVSWWPFRQLEAQGLHPLWATALIYGLAVVVITLSRPSAWQELLRTPSLWVLVLASGTTNATFNWAVTFGDVVRVIRRFKPDVLVTCDPQTLFAGYGINHPDHRAAGQATMDAVFPAAGSPVFFPELLVEGYPPHMPREIWCSLTMQPNVTMDITGYWPVKLEALLQHKTQIGEVDKFIERMKSRHTEDSTDESPRYEEKFRVVKYG